MRKRRYKKQSLVSEINITPFTDVILVLLIIFMVTTPLLMQSGIKIQLPKADARDSVSKTVTVTISNSGGVYINNKKYDFYGNVEGFKRTLSNYASNMDSDSVIVSGDRSVKYDLIIQVLDAISQTGLKRVALAVESKR